MYPVGLVVGLQANFQILIRQRQGQRTQWLSLARRFTLILLVRLGLPVHGERYYDGGRLTISRPFRTLKSPLIMLVTLGAPAWRQWLRRFKVVSAEQTRDTGAASVTRRMSDGFKMSAVPSCNAAPASPQQQLESHPLSQLHAPMPPISPLYVWRPDLTKDVPSGSRRRSASEISNSNTKRKQ
jgi:hypothetical protein